jgi:hypothetical protein
LSILELKIIKGLIPISGFQKLTQKDWIRNSNGHRRNGFDGNKTISKTGHQVRIKILDEKNGYFFK